ncbi:MAG: hypothetical protein D6798_09245 [Deltaproteobacteria bacterium]|nr:MAG: hypothetical protein D6798_09245 [Deltaproteobacteria bacterium]
MSGPLLALLLSIATPAAIAQDPTGGGVPASAADTAAPTPEQPAAAGPTAEAPADDDSTDAQADRAHDRALAAAEARTRKARADLARARRNLRLTMALVALLVLWLIARLATPRPTVEHPHHRVVALNHDELGRLIFQAARSRDFFAFRDLFLNAHEAGELLGLQEAENYLELRSDEHIRKALDVLADACRPGTTYGGVVPVEGGLLGIRVNEPNGGHFVVAVGSVTEIEGGCRLHLASPRIVSETPATSTPIWT